VTTTKRQLREDIAAAFEHDDGIVDLSPEQLRALIAFEAEEIGLTLEEAVQRARERTLPNNLIGTDLRFLVMLLDDCHDSTC
jgi:hypothetical protein